MKANRREKERPETERGREGDRETRYLVDTDLPLHSIHLPVKPGVPGWKSVC